MTTRRVVRTLVVVGALLLIQTTAGVNLRIGGVHPDLMWLPAIAAALVGGTVEGAVVGFVAGLAADLVLPTPFGLSALVGTLLGAGVGRVTASTTDPGSWWLAPTVAALGSAAAVMLYAVLGAVLGQEQMLRVDLGAVVAVVTLANALLARPAVRLFRWALGPPSIGRRRTLATGARW